MAAKTYTDIPKLDSTTIKFLINEGLFTNEQLKELIDKKTKKKEQLMNIGESINAFLQKLSENFHSTTVFAYKQYVESFLVFFYNVENIDDIKEKTLKYVSVRDVENWLDYVSSTGYNQSRLPQFKSGLIKYFNFLEGSGINVPDISIAELPKIELKEIEAIKEDEVMRLINIAPTYRSKALISFIYETGMKINELTICKKSHIDFEKRTVEIYKKNKVDRIGYLSKDGAKLIEDYIKQWEWEVKEINEKRLTNAVMVKKVYKEVIVSEYLFQTVFAERIGHATIQRDISKAVHEYYLNKGYSEEEINDMKDLITTETLRNSRRVFFLSEGKSVNQVKVLMGDDNTTRVNQFLLVAQKLYPEKFVN